MGRTRSVAALAVDPFRQRTVVNRTRGKIAVIGCGNLGYPLHPPQRPSELRTEHFPRLQTPAMFVHGTRNGFGSIDEVVAALKLIQARTKLLPVAGAGHELVTKRNPR
jgi:predicted alpha/beta-hydrolase family hydrolase